MSCHLGFDHLEEQNVLVYLGKVSVDVFLFDLLDGKNLRSFGSTGQIRLTALMLKLGEYLLLRQTELPVIVLADDVTGDLDAERCRLFFDTISDADQQFFTFARDPQFPQLAGAKRLTL